MTDVVTDTHGLIWYLEDSPRLSAAARDAFDRCDRGEKLVYVPTICLGLPLISRDQRIRLSEVNTIW